MKSRSVLGISSLSRYSEVPINSSTVIYHYLKSLPFSSYGEVADSLQTKRSRSIYGCFFGVQNVIVLAQNLACVAMLWAFRVPRVKTQEILLCLTVFIALCAIELSLPPPLQPLLIYINIPLVFGTTLPQVFPNADIRPRSLPVAVAERSHRPPGPCWPQARDRCRETPDRGCPFAASFERALPPVRERFRPGSAARG